jgi:hypothetical protein
MLDRWRTSRRFVPMVRQSWWRRSEVVGPIDIPAFVARFDTNLLLGVLSVRGQQVVMFNEGAPQW